MSNLFRSKSSSSNDYESMNEGSLDDYDCSPSTSSSHGNVRLSGDSSSPVSTSPAAIEVANMMTALNLVPSVDDTKDPNHWFHRMCSLIACVIQNRPRGIDAALQERLSRHLRRLENGDLSVTLVGAAYLKIHPDIYLVRCEETDSFPEYLPSPIRQKLFHGKFVPIRHILYAEALKLGFVTYVIDKKKVDADPYPLHLKEDLPPADFLQAIRRPDIIRGMTTHSLTLSARFPRISAKMHNLIRHMWILIYQEEFSVQAAMDLYDHFFEDFERHLNSLTYLDMKMFPSNMIKNVLEKQLNNNYQIS